MFEFEIPHGTFGGYIFDCDGTLVDSMPAHHEAWKLALAEFGHPGIFPEEIFYSLGGVPTADIVAGLNERHGLRLDPEQVCLRKEVLFESLSAGVPLIRGVADFARKIAGAHPVAVASGGTRLVIERTLRLAGLADLFPVVVTAEDVRRGKPAPDCFLLAAGRMGVAPRDCLVFEDSGKGIEAARAAGMQAVLVRRTGPA